MAKAQNTTSATNTAEQQPHQSDARPTLTHHTVTCWRSDDHSTYLGPRSVGAVGVALQGIQTILAILVQQEADKATDGHGLVLSPYTVEGLLCAAESCTQVVVDAVSGKHSDAHSFDHGTPEGMQMSEYAWHQRKKADERLRA
jgi:hypothetical protein